MFSTYRILEESWVITQQSREEAVQGHGVLDREYISRQVDDCATRSGHVDTSRIAHGLTSDWQVDARFIAHGLASDWRQ
jgi:hypothetical protein